MCRSIFKKCLFIFLLYAAQGHALDKVSLDERTRLFSVSDKTAPIITATYVGWEANWKWAGPNFKKVDNNLKVKPNSKVYVGVSPVLDMDFTVTAELKPNQIEWDYHLDKKSNHPDAIGFGIQFDFKLDSPAFKVSAQPPELLADNEGWRWQTPDGQSIEVTFTPAIAKVFNERNQKNNVRALFFTSASKGIQRIKMTVKVSKGVEVTNPTASYAAQDSQMWRSNVLSNKVSPIDLSFLNSDDLPAGKHGFVKAKADKLVFEDGTQAKFWGTNIMANALFSTSDPEIKTHSKRLAQLGYNLVRFTHIDTKWVKPNIFKNQDANTQELSADAFKKLDWWIKCLKEQGIYVWLDLHVYREVTKHDGVEHFDEMAKGKASATIAGFNYYNTSIQREMQAFNEAYLNHVNPHTRLAYKADPAVIALLLTNENDLTQHFGNLMLPDKGNPKHNEAFTVDYKKFAQANNLPENKVFMTWDVGESKIYLSDVEHRFNQSMIAHLRDLGAKPMLATTNNWGGMGLFGLPSLADGDIIDAHSYGHAEEFKDNPRFNPSFLAWIGAAQVTGKPLSVTEWNFEPFPVVDRFTMPIYTASIAALQGWDAMMIYGYSQQNLDLNRGDNYSTYTDPAITGVMPAAALLYRQSHISPSKNNYELKLGRDDFFLKKQDPTTSKTLRTLLETSRFSVTIPDTKELPWVAKATNAVKATVITDTNKDYIPEGQDFVQSDTGELRRDWGKGLHSINTPKSQVASGWVGGKEHQLKDVNFKINTKNAVVAVQSVDGNDIKKSNHIFITAMARSEPNSKDGSFSSETVAGTIEISAPAGLLVYPINPLGLREKPIKAAYAKGKYTVDLDGQKQSHWYELSGR